MAIKRSELSGETTVDRGFSLAARVACESQKTSMQVFISYAHRDQKIAKELSLKIAKALTSKLSVPAVKVWLADNEVLPGENLSLETGKALEQSNAMVVLLSPDAVESRYVRSEIAYALSSPKFEGRVIPVVIKPTKDIPWFLHTLAMIHARGTDAQSVKRIAEKIVDSLAEAAKEGEVVQRVSGGSKVAHR